MSVNKIKRFEDIPEEAIITLRSGRKFICAKGLSNESMLIGFGFNDIGKSRLTINDYPDFPKSEHSASDDIKEIKYNGEIIYYPSSIIKVTFHEFFKHIYNKNSAFTEVPTTELGTTPCASILFDKNYYLKNIDKIRNIYIDGKLVNLDIYYENVEHDMLEKLCDAKTIEIELYDIIE